MITDRKKQGAGIKFVPIPLLSTKIPAPLYTDLCRKKRSIDGLNYEMVLLYTCGIIRVLNQL
jgi:hypothetical protein